jgi:hypothetical protein
VDIEEPSKEEFTEVDFSLSAKLSLAQAHLRVGYLSNSTTTIQEYLRSAGLVPLFTCEVNTNLMTLTLMSMKNPSDALVIGYPFNYKTDGINETMEILLMMAIGYPGLIIERGNCAFPRSG